MAFNIRSSKILNFCYLGASKFVLARVDCSNLAEPRLVFFKETKAQGFHRGRVSDLELASRDVQRLFQAAELDNFPEITLVISHPDVKGYTFSSSIFYSAPRRALEASDLDEVIRQTRNVSMVPLKETILQSIPQEYWVNDVKGIQNPLDLEAERLGVSARLLSVEAEDQRNLVKIFDRSEAEIKTVIPKALASSYSTLEETEKRSGVLLIEVGGYATDLVYFKEGILQYSKSFSWGGDALTHNLSDRFHLKTEEARQIKEQFGTLLEGVTDEEKLPLSSEEHGALVIKRGELRELLTSSLETLWEKLDPEIRYIQEKETSLSHLVLSGGGAKLEGLLEKIESRYSIRTRLGNPKPFGLDYGSSVPSDSRLSALWGAVKHGIEKLKQEKSSRFGQSLFVRASSQAREWLESYF